MADVPHDPWWDAARRGVRTRYARRRATTAEELADSPLLPTPTVYEPEPVDTGVLDADGYAIVRMMAPIGFVELVERE